MSSTTTIDQKHLLHIWDVTVDREVPESGDEVVNGQKVTVTRQVKKSVVTRMALRELGRRESKTAELFRASRIAFYSKPPHNLLLASELTNRLINTTGGVLTDREKARVEELRAKHVQLDMDLSRGATTLTAVEKDAIQKELATVRAELLNLQAINEDLYSQTADAKAQADLSNWMMFNLIVIEKDGKWVPYFEGDTFEKKEEFMWSLEDAKDPLYLAAVDGIVTAVYWLSKGVNTPEGFKLIAEEMKKQQEAEKAAAAPAPAQAETPAVEDHKPDETPTPVTPAAA